MGLRSLCRGGCRVSLAAPQLALCLLARLVPRCSTRRRNRSDSFSIERLMDFLSALGQDAEITVRPARKRHGEVVVG